MEAALWCYGWDLAGEPERFLEWASNAGINQLNVAGTYHAGWFLHPARQTRAFMPEDGVCYYHPDLALYESTRLKPQVASVCAGQDWFRLAAAKAGDFGLRMASWTIGTHNTRLGSLHPELCTVNCFGDVYPHGLCPAHPEVANYLIALCRDLTHTLPLHAIQTESFGYLGWRHGHHHERDLTGLTDDEAKLMNLCFHPATMAKAAEAGIDAEGLRIGVREMLASAMAEAPDRPEGYPGTWAEILEKLPAITAYQAVCRGIEVGIIAAVRGAMRPDAELHVGGNDPVLAPYVTTYATGVYGLSPTDSIATVTAARAKVPSNFKLQVGLRLGMGVPATQAELTETLAGIQAAGADRVIFYNASEAPPKMLSWIGPSLKEVRK